MGDVVMGLWAAGPDGANASSEQLAIYLLLGDPATVLPDRTDLAPPPVVVDPPEEDGGVTVPGTDSGRPRVDNGTDRPEPPVVTPPGGALGGGACAVSVGTTENTTSGLLLLLAVVTWVGRRARRRAR